MANGAKKIALALDLEPSEAVRLGGALAGEVGFLKIGLSLFCSEGPAIVRELKARGARIFLDLKLHDIPNTVELAARNVGKLGVDLVTLHASGGKAMLAAAVKGLAEGAASIGAPAPRALAVTALTSLDAQAIEEIGFCGSAAQVVERLARLAKEAGAHGIVCSPKEVAAVRSAVGPGMLLVTPGIRPAGAAMNDQARAETPAAAIAAGSDLLVIGRPILQASDPIAAARAIAAAL